jgi:hypothetical protein
LFSPANDQMNAVHTRLFSPDLEAQQAFDIIKDTYDLPR